MIWENGLIAAILALGGMALTYFAGYAIGEMRGRRFATEECTRQIDKVIAAKAQKTADNHNVAGK